MSDKPLPPPPDDINALPPGTRFGELEIIKLLGTGGFGLVYLAHDHALERLVAIKEYMPSQLAQRGQNSQVSVRSGSMRETFELGLRSFVNEARLLARFDHRSLLKVYRFWEANHTAYMAVPYLQGQTLQQWREASGVAPSGTWLLQKLRPLLEALEVLHAERVYHRDIAPDNIFLPQDGGDPILLDFGAARRAISDTTQSFTAILKPSYAPLEQYDGASAMRQGPWTDLYALGAVLYHLITGHPPAAATRRALADDFEPLSTERFPEQPEPLLRAINWALSLRPAERPQSVAQWRDGLEGRLEMPAPAPAPTAQGLSELAKLGHVAEPTQWQPRNATLPQPQPTEAPLEAEVRAAATANPVAAPVATVPLIPPRVAPAEGAKAGPAHPMPWTLLGLGAAVALLLAFWWVLRGNAGDAPPGSAAAAVDIQQVASAATAASQGEESFALAPGESLVVALPADAARPTAAASVPAASATPQPTSRSATRPEVRANSQPPRATQASPGAVASPSASPAVEAPSRAGPAPVVSEAPVAATEPASGHADPRAACGSRVFIALAMCIDRNCRDPAFAKHPECVRLRELREERQRSPY